jgi:hypothetical protein
MQHTGSGGYSDSLLFLLPQQQCVSTKGQSQVIRITLSGLCMLPQVAEQRCQASRQYNVSYCQVNRQYTGCTARSAGSTLHALPGKQAVQNSLLLLLLLPCQLAVHNNAPRTHSHHYSAAASSHCTT